MVWLIDSDWSKFAVSLLILMLFFARGGGTLFRAPKTQVYKPINVLKRKASM